VDDNSPDGTGNIVENYVKSKSSGKNEKTLKRNVDELNETRIKVIHRKEKRTDPCNYGRSCGVKWQIYLDNGCRFSHPPEVIPKMLEELRINPE
jgi:dolichol-phosphate mannosyltransferase